MIKPQIILASASPRRLELLHQIGVKCEVHPVDIDESAKPNEPAIELVQRLAMEKAEAAWQQTDGKLPVLGSDTLGLIGTTILVKPSNFSHAREMLLKMSANWHDIFTAVAICSKHKRTILLSKSRVRFAKLSEQDIENYWNTGEPQDKAGAYAIQGIGAVFVEKLEGSYSGVMGLPLRETMLLLNSINIKAPF